MKLLTSIYGAEAESCTAAVREASVCGQPVTDALLAKLQVSEGEFLPQLAAGLGWAWIPEVKVAGEESAALKQAFAARLAITHRVLPLELNAPVNDEAAASEGEGGRHTPVHGRLRLACYDAFDVVARQAVSRSVSMRVEWCLAPKSEVLRGIQSLYGVGADTFDDLIKSRELDGEDAHLRDEANLLDGDDAEASVVKFVNQIIREALAQRATDIHVEPLQESLRIRYRIDGELHEASVPDNIKALQSSLLARIKVMARLDIAEKRLPQDGRIHLKLDNQSMDVRVACIPSVEGESISLRLLGQERFTLDKLGLSSDYRQKVEDLLARPNGIVLVTGPTGSGKSTTLYTFLSHLNQVNRRIVTIEDPVENKLQGVVQIAVKPEINLTFASGLRSILRGDPNVVMVGEIRDLETAEIAVRASLTGHLVFSTLHTNDSIGGITRLVEMGVEPFLVGSSVRAFIAQRLVRSLCKYCREAASYTEERLHACQFADGIGRVLYKARGCQHCRGTGYHGRLAIYEMAILSPALQDMITQRAASSALLRQARQEGFMSMREYGWQKVLEGVTTLEEVMRVTSEDRPDVKS